MADLKMHIAARGKNAGQWVYCRASGSCPVQGVHSSSAVLKDVKKWAGVKTVKDVTATHLAGFLKDKIKGSGNGGQRLTADEADKVYAEAYALDGKVTKQESFSFNKSEWMNFPDASYRHNVSVPLDFIKKTGAAFRTSRIVNLNKVPLKGKPENVERLLAEFS